MIGAEDIVRFECSDPQSSRRFQEWKSYVLADGRLSRPLMAETLPCTLLPPSVGRVELHAVPEARFLNPMGTVHGGWAMTMLDSAMGLSAQSTLEPDESCPSPYDQSSPMVGPDA
jgi:acyl-coenzyme A thioesterase PaaI-like protein